MLFYLLNTIFTVLNNQTTINTMTTQEIKIAAEKLYSSIQQDEHTVEQQDVLRRELGIYAENATAEQIESLINQAVEGGFEKELQILTA